MNEIETKEISVVKRQVTMAMKEATDLFIDSKESMEMAGEVRKRIKQVGALIKARKEKITKPLNEALKSARDLFRPLEENHEEAEAIVGQKMITYQKQVDEERQGIEAEANTKKAEIDRKLAEGEITESSAKRSEKSIEKKIGKAPEEVKKGESYHTRTIKKFRVIDRTKIPLEYMMVNEVAVRGAMLQDVVVPGIEYYLDKIIV